MKKGLFFIGVLMFACSANAQLFTGGSIGVGFGNNKNNDGEKISQNFNLGLSPEVGYSITDKIDVGMGVGFGFQREKQYYDYGYLSGEIKSDVFTWNVAPFMQYHFWKVGKFSFVARSVMHFGGEIDKFFAPNNDRENKHYSYGFSVSPVIHYNLNDRFTLLTDLRFLSLNIGGSFVKDGGRDFGFSFGTDSGNLLNLNQLKIGFIYTF